MAVALANSTTFQNKTAGSSFTVPVPTGGFPANSLIVVLFGATADTSTTEAAMAVSDPTNGAYTKDVSWFTLNNGMAGIFSKYSTSALAAGTNITIANAGTSWTAKSGEVLCFTGVLPTGKDKTGQNVASGTSAPSVTANTAWTATTAVLSSASELAVGMLTMNTTTGDTVTMSTGFTAAGAISTSGGSGSSNRATYAGYGVFSGTTAVTWGPKDATSAHNGASMVATYRAAPDFVQAISQTGAGSVTTAHFNTAPVSGNAIVVAVATNATTTARVASVTDSASNAYSKISGFDFAGSANQQEWWIAHNITSGGLTHTVTVTTSSSSDHIAAVALELSGLALSGAPDSFYAATGSGTAFSSGATATLQAANDIVLGFGVENQPRPLTLGAGFTNLTQNTGDAINAIGVETKTQYGSTSAATATLTNDGTTVTYNMGVATFSGTSIATPQGMGGGGGSPPTNTGQFFAFF